MSIFSDINCVKLDSFIFLVDNCKDRLPEPVLTKERDLMLKSGDTISKSKACVQILVEWQNTLNKRKNNPDSQSILNASDFCEFYGSQQLLNKLKRKFSKLLIENMALPHQALFAREAACKLNLQYSDVSLASRLFKYHGDDAICLEMIGPHANHCLNPSVFPRKELVSLQGDPQSNQPDIRLVLSVSSTAEQFPLASNTWGFPRQEASPLCVYTKSKSIDAINRNSELNSVYTSVLWEKFPNPFIKESKFNQYIINAKFFNGSPIANCGERSTRIFHQVTKQRDFEPIHIASITPGDHWVTVSKGLILEGWNGAKIYPEADISKHLYDYKGFDLSSGMPELKKFDPNLQKLIPVIYNIYPFEAFKNDSKTKHPELINLLGEFHQIPNTLRRNKMMKALEIIRFIENKMPLYEIHDPAVCELNAQMLYLTKKERENGLQIPPQNNQDRCLINEALQKLDPTSLQTLLYEKMPMDGMTLFHAIKASLLTNNIGFLACVVNAGVPIRASCLTQLLDPDLITAVLKFAEALAKACPVPTSFVYLCTQAIIKQFGDGKPLTTT